MMSDTDRQALRRRDNDLVGRFQKAPESRDGRAALNELLKAYRQPVYQWCFRFSRHHEAALDLAQDVMLRMYRALPGFQGRCAFSSWVFSITRNHCLNHLRNAGRLVAVEKIDGFESNEPAVDRLLVETEDESRLLAKIRGVLGETEQQAIWMRCIEGLTVDEITRALGLENLSGARALLQRARRKLRAALDDPRRATGDES